MATDYTSTGLLEQIKRRAFVPTNQSTFTDAEILEMASEEMQSIVVPAILSAREEWYVVVEDFIVDSTTNKVAIPPRAIGGAVREVTWLQGDVEWNLPRQSLEDRVYKDNQGPIQSVYLQGNDIHFIGQETGALRIYYHCRPGELVRTSQAGQITAFDAGANTITVSNVPTGWATGTIVDIIQGVPHFSHKAVNATIQSISGNIITLDSLPGDIATSDWVAPMDQSPIPQVPVEWFSYVAQACAVQILESVGDTEAAERAISRRDKLHKTAMQLVTPRIVGETKKAVPQKNRAAFVNPIWSGKP